MSNAEWGSTTEAAIIERVLKHLVEIITFRPTRLDLQEIDVSHALNHDMFDRTMDKLEELEVIGHPQGEPTRYKLLKLGHQIIDMGGWAKYCEHEANVRRDLKQRVTWFWWSARIAVLSVMVALGGLWYTMYKAQGTEQRLSQLEQLRKDQTNKSSPVPLQPTGCCRPKTQKGHTPEPKN